MSSSTERPPGRLRARLPRLSRRFAVALILSLAAVSVASALAVAEIVGTPNKGHLTAFGPTSGATGFPTWYKDDKGTRLEPCLDVNNTLCGFLPGDVPDPNSPLSVPDNFPEEAFYMLAGNTLDTSGGRAVTTLSLEGAFANGAPAANDQIVFGRVRFFFDGLKAGETYKITHPYGVDKFVAEQDPGAADGVGRIRFTEDIGVAQGQFGEALNSRIGPFLKWDPAIAPAAPTGYIGDPDVLHPVTGSPNGTNFIRIEGPGVAANPADQCSPTPAGENAQDCIQSNDFSLMGKLATTGGVDVPRVTYSRAATDTNGGMLDVFATSDNAPQSIEVSGDGFDPTRLRGANGEYEARVAFTGAQPPATVKVTNVGDQPASVKTATVTDRVSGRAIYNADTQRLNISGNSTDLANPPTLTATGFGQLTNGLLSALRRPGVPDKVTITSSAGGSVTVPVEMTGGSFAPIPVVAFAGADQEVLVDSPVALDGSGSTGPITGYSWTQTAGPAVTLTGADTAHPTFTAPSAADLAPGTDATLSFQLTVTGAGGPQTNTVNVHVLASAPAPVANAGADQTVAEDSVVTLDASGSTGATSYSWTQTGGPAVTLTGANTANPTFRFPKQNVVLTFQVTAKGAAGSSTDEVQISTTPDKLATSRVQYVQSKRDWRIDGTSSLGGPGVTITVHNGTTLGGAVVGKANVDALGNWSVTGTTSFALDASRRVSIESSAGGQLLGVAVTVK
jgi:hypothetical protein